MRIILDTGVFFYPEALAMMRWYAAPIIVPSVVFAERARQLARIGVHEEALREKLDTFGATIEALGPAEATRFATRITDDKKWARLARDAFIAGHVRDDDRLFTTNVADFVEVGVPESQILEVPAWRQRPKSSAGDGAARPR